MFMIPILFGLMVGFVAVAGAFRLGQRVVVAESLPTPVSTSAPPGATRVVVLLLNSEEEDVAGVWQWWSDVPGNSGKAACVLSTETRIAPSGRSVGEMMRLAMAAGDDSWVARNTQDFAGDCLLGQASEIDQVLFVSWLGMVKLVDALGGIELEGRTMDGAQVWEYLASADVAPAETQRRQSSVWLALKTTTKRARRPACDRILAAENLFRSIPSDQDPCRRFETLIRETPPYIAVP
jgi:hypothetical protein